MKGQSKSLYVYSILDKTADLINAIITVRREVALNMFLVTAQLVTSAKMAQEL